MESGNVFSAKKQSDMQISRGVSGFLHGTLVYNIKVPDYMGPRDRDLDDGGQDLSMRLG